MELESDLAKELFNKVILPIQAKNIDSKKTYQNIPVKQDNTEEEKKHREALLRLNKRHQRDIKETQKEMKRKEELEKRREEEQKRREELENLNKITESEQASAALPPPVSSVLEKASAPVSSALEKASAPVELSKQSVKEVSPILPPTPPNEDNKCKAVERDIIPSEDCNPNKRKPTHKARLRFHPDRNFQCQTEAGEKFKELQNICGKYKPAQETTQEPAQETTQEPAKQPPEPPAIKAPEPEVNKETLLSENNIDNLLTILRKALSQKQDDNELIRSQLDDNKLVEFVNNSDVEPGTLSQKHDDNELVIIPSDDNELIEPVNVNNNSVVEPVVRTHSATTTPATTATTTPVTTLAATSAATSAATTAATTASTTVAPAVVTSCDDEDCQEPINTSQSQQVSPEQDISLTTPSEDQIASLTQKIPELNIGDKMSWISQALAALFSTIGNLFTFEPVQDNDPYINEEKEREGYVYVGKMYMKPEDETKRPEKVKYINYNPTKKDFYIDEREEVKE